MNHIDVARTAHSNANLTKNALSNHVPQLNEMRKGHRELSYIVKLLVQGRVFDGGKLHCLG
jgi:hypothetical protein